jgi:hypothetical protein
VYPPRGKRRSLGYYSVVCLDVVSALCGPSLLAETAAADPPNTWMD